MYLTAEQELTELRAQRHFVRIAGRNVHFRTAGSGPAVMLFHQSPTSSAELASEIAFYAQHFTVIAPDTPGYGWSDPLPLEHPEIADFADAAIALADALGVASMGVLGTHTGAMIAADLAVRYPARVAAAVLDGFVVLTDAERTDLLANYFTKPAPTPEGSHLAWAWARIRDQMIFYPWYRKTRAARMRFDVASAAMLQPYLLDLLRAYAGGVPAYRAAFAYDAQHAARNFAAPTFLLNYPADAIADHPERLAHVSPAVQREMLSDPQSLANRAVAIFQQAAIPPVILAEQQSGRVAMTGPSGSQLCMHHSGAQPPVLLIHQPGASMGQWHSVMANNDFGWLAIDLPGHGRSEPVRADFESFEQRLQRLLEEHNVQAMVTMGDSGWLAAAAARLADIPHIAINLDADPARSAVAELTPEDYGGHLLKAWYAVRDGELFYPWNAATLANSLDREFALDPTRLTSMALDLLVAAPSLGRWKQWATAAAQTRSKPAHQVWQASLYAKMGEAEPGAEPAADDAIWPDEEHNWTAQLISRLHQILDDNQPS